MKVGIPRGLMYYKYFPFWKTLLEDLGNQVVVSPKTDVKVLKDGTDSCVDDICVAVKVFFGHVLALKDGVDYIMIPRLVSVERGKGQTFTCPKFIALPDMIRHNFSGLPQLLEFTVDLQNQPLWISVFKLCSNFSRNPLKIWSAYRHALETQEKYERLLRYGFSPDEAVERLEVPEEEARMEAERLREKNDLCIAVLSHPYLIYDEFISQNLRSTLRKMNARMLAPAMLEADIIKAELACYDELAWSYEKDLVGAGSHFLKSKEVDGIIFIICFACGPDSITTEIILREVREQCDNPIMPLVIDEHTGTAGLHTRIEAFVDMVKRQKSHQPGKVEGT